MMAGLGSPFSVLRACLGAWDVLTGLVHLSDPAFVYLLVGAESRKLSRYINVLTQLSLKSVSVLARVKPTASLYWSLRNWPRKRRGKGSNTVVRVMGREAWQVGLRLGYAPELVPRNRFWCMPLPCSRTRRCPYYFRFSSKHGSGSDEAIRRVAAIGTLTAPCVL